jgi:type IV fimbrial biogenesis protein FimT
MSKQLQRGFTLVELIVVMAIMAVIMAIAAPNVGEMLANYRLNNTVGSLISDLNVARTESIKSGQPVIVICEGAPCTENPISWTGGWQICYSNNATSCDASTAVRTNPIRRNGALSTGQVLEASSRTATFYPTGYTNSTTVSFDAASKNNAGTKNTATLKNITVTSSGSITSLSK